MVLADGHAGESGFFGHDGLVHHRADAIRLGVGLPGAWIWQVIPEDQQIDIHKGRLYPKRAHWLGPVP
ncbi:hypothetical protein GCM10022419_041440 [Nonomuraea rosea]|uniref:Uncharacterized protein n=1 Tax=Nonomuraea rosea TaxID=638574 RepID=A0ABP6WTW9_9ACTN